MIGELKKFEGDLAGKYFSMTDLSAEDEASLEADHFMLRQGDRFQEGAGLNDNWP